VSTIDVTDPGALEAALDAVPEGQWVEVDTAGEAARLVRVFGGWYLPGDLVVASGDVAGGRPLRVEVLGGDPVGGLEA